MSLRTCLRAAARRLSPAAAACPQSGRRSRGLSTSAADVDPTRPVSAPVMSVAVLVERLPVVLPKPPDWFLAYQQFSFERSQQNRKTYPAEFLAAAAEPPTDDSEKVGADEAMDIQTTTDPMAFFDAPSRRTSADAANDTRSTQRALDKHLYLLVRTRTIGKLPGNVPDVWSSDWAADRWRLPEALYSGEDTLRQCAEATIKQQISGDPKDVYFIGNAPFVHVESKTEEGEANGGDPCKRFFFWSRWVGKEPKMAPGAVSDYGWFTKAEVLSLLDSARESRPLDELLLE